MASSNLLFTHGGVESLGHVGGLSIFIRRVHRAMGPAGIMGSAWSVVPVQPVDRFHPWCVHSLMGKEMNRINISFVATAIALSLGFAAPVQAQNADEIMALAKSQWAAQDQSKPAAEAMATVADDYTEFNPGVPVLVEGKALASRFYEGSLKGGDTGVISEMLNPHVQFYGDVAILSYNFAGLSKDKDGKITPNNAKSTRVYVRKGGKWMLVHANFAPVAAAN